MATKLLTEQRGPLQGVDVDGIIRSAYGPEAQFRKDPDGVTAGLIVKPAPEEQGPQAFDVIDHVIEVHEE